MSEEATPTEAPAVVETPPEPTTTETPAVDAIEPTTEATAEATPTESAALTAEAIQTQLNNDAQLFENGDPNSPEWLAAAERLDAAGWLEDAGDENDDEPEFDFGDDDDPNAQMRSEWEQFKAQQQQQAAAQEQQAAQERFYGDLSEALGGEVPRDFEQMTAEQRVLAWAGLGADSIPEAQKAMAERDAAIKKQAIADYIEGKSDVELPPEVSRTATSTVESEGTLRNEIAAAGIRQLHGTR